jgi:hypothetical protein
MCVSKNSGSVVRASVIAAATSGDRASRCSVTQVGGASSISSASRRAIASAGWSHRWSRISPMSTVTAPAGAGPTKNQVANRLAVTGGGTQCANGSRVSASTTRSASSSASRTAAWRAASITSPSGGMSSGSTRPPGNTHIPPANSSFELRRTIRVSTPPSGASRNKTTVAAGTASGTSPLVVGMRRIHLGNESLMARPGMR